ncbi:hypothetical protein [Tumebacillus flagellatus]|uniref:Uncharacterized protein n=1 Tax=Tumebacillus flagellatus TaxID=1157490 RepID=A0A074LUV1_9BACL|nr:hypothetical protein [Tumebacillus flagellatus]KEO84400.1 hypothetical protein EL26_04670 [Tumebacillus flagellatus]
MKKFVAGLLSAAVLAAALVAVNAHTVRAAVIDPADPFGKVRAAVIDPADPFGKVQVAVIDPADPFSVKLQG